MKNIDELNKLYTEAESADKSVFSEMRSAVLLVAGEHYQKSNQKAFERLRDAKSISNDTKIRLTKNHSQKIVKGYVNHIISAAPNVRVVPQLENELQDKKSAELNQAVWVQIKRDCDITETGKILDWCDDFVTIAEVCTKYWWDKFDGYISGYEPVLDEQGQQVFTLEDGTEISEEMIGQMEQMGAEIQAEPKVDESKPIYSGKLKLEDYHGFNVLRCPTAKKMEDSPYLILRKMARVKELKKQFPDVAEKIETTDDKTFLVFDTSSYGYRQSEKDECLVKEIYYRVCMEYPEGYYYICTESVILEEGTLPNKMFPVVHETFDRAATTPRGIGVMKTVRPYQVEINRTASKIAEHQMTVGDDKIITMNGSKLSSGAQLPGVREMKVTGQPPIVLEGRSGSQFVEHGMNQIAELYEVTYMSDLMQKNSDGQYDAYAMLYQAARRRAFFQRHIAKFERYLKKVCELGLEFAKYYWPDDMVVYAVGKREQVNLPEFKKTEKQCYQIAVEEQNGDIETQMGKQLIASQIMQYAAGRLESDDLGKLIKNMPFANLDDSFNDLTMDYDNATNLILALDRGDMPEPGPADNAEYLLRKFNNRMGMSDFAFLHPYIQGNYKMKMDQYSQILDEQKQKTIRDAAGLIPTTGASIGVDMYVAYDPEDPTKSRRARIPNDALQWLVDKLEDQGMMVSPIENLPMNVQAGMPDGQQQMNLDPSQDMGGGEFNQ